MDNKSDNDLLSMLPSGQLSPIFEPMKRTLEKAQEYEKNGKIPKAVKYFVKAQEVLNCDTQDQSEEKKNLSKLLETHISELKTKMEGKVHVTPQESKTVQLLVSRDEAALLTETAEVPTSPNESEWEPHTPGPRDNEENESTTQHSKDTKRMSSERSSITTVTRPRKSSIIRDAPPPMMIKKRVRFTEMKTMFYYSSSTYETLQVVDSFVSATRRIGAEGEEITPLYADCIRCILCPVSDTELPEDENSTAESSRPHVALLNRLPAVFGITELRHEKILRSLTKKYTHQEVINDLNTQLNELSRHPFYMPESFENTAAYERWMQQQTQRLKSLIEKVQHKVGIAATDLISPRKEEESDASPSASPREKTSFEQKEGTPSGNTDTSLQTTETSPQSDTTAAPIFIRARRYDQLFKTLLAVDTSAMNYDEMRLFQLRGLFEKIETEIIKLKDTDKINIDAMISRVSPETREMWETALFMQTPFSRWLLNEYAERYGISPVFQLLTSLNNFVTNMKCKFDHFVLLHVLLQRTLTTFRNPNTVYNRKELEIFKETVERMRNDVTHYLEHIFRYFKPSTSLITLQMLIKLYHMIIDCMEFCQCSEPFISYADHVPLCLEESIRTYYYDMLFNAEEAKSFAAVATPVEHTNEAKDEKEKKDKHKKDKDKDSSDTLPDKNNFVIIMNIPNYQNDINDVINNSNNSNSNENSNSTDALQPSTLLVPLQIDLENLFTVREEESNVVSASPITFGRRIWGRGERKITPRQLATLTDNILAELPLLSKYDKIFQSFNIKFEERCRSQLFTMLFLDVKVFLMRYAKDFAARKVLELGMKFRDINNTWGPLVKFGDLPPSAYFGKICLRWADELEQYLAAWVALACKHDKWEPINTRENFSLSFKVLRGKLKDNSEFMQNIESAQLFDATNNSLLTLYQKFGLAICQALRLYIEHVYNQFVLDFPQELFGDLHDIFNKKRGIKPEDTSSSSSPAMTKKRTLFFSKKKKVTSSLTNSEDLTSSTSPSLPSPSSSPSLLPSLSPKTPPTSLSSTSSSTSTVRNTSGLTSLPNISSSSRRVLPSESSPIKSVIIPNLEQLLTPLKIWPFTRVAPNDKKLKKLKKGKTTVNITPQMLVKLNSLRALAKYLGDMKKDSYLSKWSKAFKKLESLVSVVNEALPKMIAFVLSLPINAELYRSLDRSRIKASKTVKKTQDDVSTYLNTQVSILSKYLSKQTSELVAIKLWRFILKKSREELLKLTDDTKVKLVEDFLEDIKQIVMKLGLEGDTLTHCINELLLHCKNVKQVGEVGHNSPKRKLTPDSETLSSTVETTPDSTQNNPYSEKAFMKAIDTILKADTKGTRSVSTSKGEKSDKEKNVQTNAGRNSPVGMSNTPRTPSALRKKERIFGAVKSKSLSNVTKAVSNEKQTADETSFSQTSEQPPIEMSGPTSPSSTSTPSTPALTPTSTPASTPPPTPTQQTKEPSSLKIIPKKETNFSEPQKNLNKSKENLSGRRKQHQRVTSFKISGNPAKAKEKEETAKEAKETKNENDKEIEKETQKEEAKEIKSDEKKKERKDLEPKKGNENEEIQDKRDEKEEYDKKKSKGKEIEHQKVNSKVDHSLKEETSSKQKIATKDKEHKATQEDDIKKSKNDFDNSEEKTPSKAEHSGKDKEKKQHSSAKESEKRDAKNKSPTFQTSNRSNEKPRNEPSALRDVTSQSSSNAEVNINAKDKEQQ